MTRAVVIDIGFGDSGKGMVVSSLCSLMHDPLVVRFSGGHQAGHNVQHEGVRHIFTNFGAGSLQGADTFWTQNCTFDPIGFMNEYDTLKEKIDIKEIKVYIHNDSPVTTPYEKTMNQKFQTVNGTCGVGFGATIDREEKLYSFKFSDLLNRTVCKIKLEMLHNSYGPLVRNGAEDFMKDFLSSVEEIRQLVHEGFIIPSKESDVPMHSNTIYEGSQGLLLDKDIGFYPHVTRSNVGRKRLDECDYHYDEVWYVMRAYQTRHGVGPMTNEDKHLYIGETPEETNETHTYQGEFRRSVLDLDLLKHALQQDRKYAKNMIKEHLVITCLDQLNSYQYTNEGHLGTAVSTDNFVEFVSEQLGFDDNVYLSRSPETGIQKWKGGKS